MKILFKVESYLEPEELDAPVTEPAMKIPCTYFTQKTIVETGMGYFIYSGRWASTLIIADNCGLYAARRLGEDVRASRVMQIFSHF